MSELSATNCGCGCESGFGGNSCIWIILLLFCCGGCGGSGFGGNNGCGNDSCIWIILLLFFCGGSGFGIGCNNGCGC
ncbi:MAG: chorion class high-cysteine HCB protein 13 [Candidatus Ruminococcus intestinipullorum]|nr:chorion class high-cysteine HCB protein 13 [Candidatus Ruminococcus intestinipullorum]